MNLDTEFENINSEMLIVVNLKEKSNSRLI